jgi:hypothetical protein
MAGGTLVLLKLQWNELMPHIPVSLLLSLLLSCCYRCCAFFYSAGAGLFG